jgi:thiamine-phosphate pyrophosphorylase
MIKADIPSVCLIISSREIPQKLETALISGIKWIQYREKELPRKEILKNAILARDLTVKYGCLLTVNDYVDIAIAVEADGVHLGQEDIPLEVAKKIFNGIIGISTHNLEEAVEAEKNGADYIGFGPVFATKTKKNALAPRDINMVSFICKKISIPVILIGGIRGESLNFLYEKGCRYVAVSSGILDGDMARNIEEFLKFFESINETKYC